jgi:hypothetical protein
MSTDQLELLLATSLRENDSQSVDVPGGRSVLRTRLERDRRAGRRRAEIGVAAAVLALLVTASLLLAGVFRDERAMPVHPVPPKVALSPSGLPIGQMEGKVARSTGRAEVSTVRLRVFPDGTGRLAPGALTGDQVFTGGFEVTFEQLGPGRVAVRYDGLACESHYAFTMSFSVRGSTLTVLGARPMGCIMSAGLVADLPGTKFRVSPLPDSPPVATVALSPSGLPIGLLDAPAIGTGHARLRVRILVRADGSGQFSSRSGVAFDVTLRPDGPGRATLVYDNPALADPEVVTLFFTVQDRTVTIGKVDTPGNGIISRAGARSMAGSTLRILRAPPTGRMCCQDIGG